MDQIATDRMNPEEILLAKESLAGINAAIDQLPEAAAEVFRRVVLERYTFAELAAKHGVQPRVVASLYELARSRLAGEVSIIPGADVQSDDAHP